MSVNTDETRRRAQLFDWDDDRPTRSEIIALCDEVDRLRKQVVIEREQTERIRTNWRTDRAALDFRTDQVAAARVALVSVSDRMDQHAYDELSAVLDDDPT